MSGIIKREDAIREICLDRCGTSPDEYRCGAMEDGTCEIINRINDLPSVDAVEVVRCKDCKHYQNEHICQYFSRFGTIETSSCAYCAYGERREERSMTRDEAIEVLRANYPDACFEQVREAVDIAIEALSEPKTGWIPVSEALPSKGQVVLDIDDKETWGDKGTWDVDKQRGW